MARITHVKKARQRYATKPVLDEDGTPQRTVVMRRNGEPKKDKRGRVITRAVVENDYDNPKPPLKCDHCQQPIEIGTPYKWVQPKSGPYGGWRRNRHAGCPSWKPSELSSSKMSGIYAAQEAFEEQIGNVESVDDVQALLDEFASDVRAVAEEYGESADNIEEGFGHETYMSEELREKQEALESWADEVESCEIPEYDGNECDECEGTGSCPDCDGNGTVDCDNCSGMGEVEEETFDLDMNPTGEQTVECDDCGATGQVDCDTCEATGECQECDGGQVEDDSGLDEWRDEVRDAVSIVDEIPV